MTYPPEAVACKMIYKLKWILFLMLIYIKLMKCYIVVKTLLKTRLVPSGKTEPKAELPQVTEACGEMEEALNMVLNYVDDVLSDRIAADNSIGRNLLKLVQVVPKMNTNELDTMLNANIKVRILAN